MLSNEVTRVLMIMRIKVSLRAKRGNLLEKIEFLFAGLLHSVRNDIIKMLPND